MLKRFLRVTDVPFAASIGLLALRVVIGAAFMFHGWGKIQHPFGWMPPGAPVPGFLQALAALSEFGGGLAWILGLLTPLASLGIASTMLVAVAMHVSQGDPFFSMGGHAYESAAVYLGISLALLLVGPGRLSVDAAVFGTKR
ncbi:DoxX family protein [Sorangium sp. So ce1000]|uniref:DoxX family protein n=1 Tax=Sorangium sp. So ce1000 TaxID=3133325 RepID=UPI003F63F912